VNDVKPTILIVEDDLDIADMLNAYFRAQAYEVLTVNWGEDGVRACQTSLPDLVILDIRLPDIDGFEVAQRLRSNRRTKDVPIIFLTDRRERASRLKGLELQADDYITKPFDIQELRLRVRNALERAKRASISNPVTKIPEGLPVDEQLTDCLHRTDWAILVVSLKNLDHFREIYGFVASDDLLRAVSLMLQDILMDYDADAFLGHISATDFVIVTRPGGTSELCSRIKRRLEQSLSYFYRDQDRHTELFREQALRLGVDDLLPGAVMLADLLHLKRELARLSNQVSH
jgi:DNA-binding response OmpR family regulator